MVEKTVKLSYGVFKNSASRKLRLAEIGRELKRRTVKLRGLFDIKFLTSEESATDVTLQDYVQMIKLIQELQDDKSLKKEKRSMMTKLFKLITDARVFINLIALNSVLQQGISKYQK